MDRGEGQHWNLAPGNLYSTPRRIDIDPTRAETIPISLDRVIPPIPEPPSTKWIKHERIRSERLSRFWGRDMYLGAHVLLPLGFDEHPDARYPFVIFHGHFPETFGGFREEPPDPNLEPKYDERFHVAGYNRIVQEQAHQFYKDWTSPGFPRAIVVEIQHANPYYDDSYAVNSANLGPYGDAIQYELIPYLEKKYRAIGAGWARFAYGGSTGGWEAMAVQVFYPDDYNGAWIACPDPIDFRAYTVVNIYEDKNAYRPDAPWKTTPRPGMRNYLGHISATLEEMNRYELVLGTKGRSGDQWDIWQAVYSPAGADGYPKPIWDKTTGAIDKEVAAYWKEHFDLTNILKRDWGKGLGRKLQGKLHIFVGEADNYLPERRRLPRRRIPEEREEPGLRRRGGLRAARRALLERRPHPPERDLAPALPPDVPAQNRRANPEVGAPRRRSKELGLLIVTAPAEAPPTLSGGPRPGPWKSSSCRFIRDARGRRAHDLGGPFRTHRSIPEKAPG